MTTLMGSVIPVDQVVDVGHPDKGQIVVKGNLKGLLRVGATVCYLDAVQ